MGTPRFTVRTIYCLWPSCARADFDLGYLAVNRLDRLTSGLMIIGLSSRRAHILSREFVQGEVEKEYIARCSGEFPAEEVVVEQPLLTVDRQMGLNIVHPEGKVGYMFTSFVKQGSPKRRLVVSLPSRPRPFSDDCTMIEAQRRAYFIVRNIVVSNRTGREANTTV